LTETDLGRRLVHATAGGNGRRAHEFDGRSFPAHAVLDEEAHLFFDPELSGGHSAVLGSPAYHAEGTLILLPDPYVAAETDQLARTRFLEAGAPPRRLAARRDDDSAGTLRARPRRSRVVEHAGARLDQDGAESLLLHETLRLGDALCALSIGDGNDSARQIGERLDRGWQRAFARRRV